MNDTTVTARAIDNIRVRLLAAQEEAAQYLGSFMPEDLGILIDTIDQELYCLDDSDSDEDDPVGGYSAVELLRQLDLDAGTWMFEGTMRHEINVIEIFATFAFARSNEGLHVLTDDPDQNDYVAAAELCADAFAALHYGHEASKRAVPAAQRELRALTFSIRARKGGEGKKKAKDENEVPFIIEQLEKIQQSGAAALTFGVDRDGHPKAFNVIRGGKVNVDACARYIDERFHDKLECQLGFIRKTIKRHLTGTETDEIQEQAVAIINTEEEADRNIFPTKYPVAGAAEE